MSDELFQLVLDRYHSPREDAKYRHRASAGLARKGHRVTAVDISAEMVQSARAAAQSAGEAVDFQVVDGRMLPFPGGTFDHALIWSQVLGNVPGAATRCSLLHEVNRTMKQDGLLSISVHNLEVCVPVVIEKGESPTATICYRHYFTTPELVRLVEDAGFTVLACDTASKYGQVGWDTLLILAARRPR